MLQVPNAENTKPGRSDLKTQQTADKAANKISAYGESPHEQQEKTDTSNRGAKWRKRRQHNYDNYYNISSSHI